MDSFAVVVVLVLAAVFAVAGAAKLFDLKGSRQAVGDFGVPASLVPAVGVLLPIAEIATALALVIHPIARWGAVAALALLLVFVGGVANAMRQGKDVDCGCFGRIYAATAGSLTLVRNGLMAALALVVVVHGPGPAVDAWVADRTAAELAATGLGTAAILSAAAAWLFWRDLRKARKTLADNQRLLAGAHAAVTPDAEGLPV